VVRINFGDCFWWLTLPHQWWSYLSTTQLLSLLPTCCFCVQPKATVSLDKKDNTGANTVLNIEFNTRVNTGVDTGVNTRLNPFYQLTHCLTYCTLEHKVTVS